MAEESDIVPIFILPDELLKEIFSYIIFIPEKMKLEQVSRKVRFVSSQPQSWKGVYKLELMMKCYKGFHPEFDMGVSPKLKGNCDGEGVSLNGIDVPFVKWPAAIQLLLKRTHIDQFIFHCGKDIDSLNSNPTVIPSLVELFQQNPNKMKIRSIEMHLCPLNRTFSKNNYIPVQDQLISLSMESVRISTSYLQEFVVDMHLRGAASFNNSFSQIWTILKKCNSLKSFAFCSDDNVACGFAALMGKPLTKVSLDGLLFDFVDQRQNINDLIDVVNGASGEGVQHLGTGSMPMYISTFCDHLSENSKEKLKILTVGGLGFPGTQGSELRNLYLIPTIFPNLQKIEFAYLKGPVVKFYEMISSSSHLYDANSLFDIGQRCRRIESRYFECLSK